MANMPSTLAPMPIDKEASHSPEMIANDPKKKVRILAQNFGLINEKAIAIGP
jgi:hypothetical protein